MELPDLELTASKIEVLREFLKEAFCVDGTVEMPRLSETVYPPVITFSAEEEKKLTGALFKVTDKERGEFYVGLFKEE